MKNSKTPFLCGGIFFFLISGIKQGVSAREHAKGIKDEVKNEDIMDDLILAIVGRRYSPNKAEVSQYRSCSANGTSGIPFDDKSVRDSLSDAIANNYIAPHKRITTFLDKYMVGEQQRTWFVKALLDIILHDETIAEDECFYIQADGSGKTKSEIRDIRAFDFQPFILGVVHFIVTKRYGCNKDGRSTFDAWKTKEGNEYRYNGNAGEGVAYKITVNDCRPSDEIMSEPDSEPETDTAPADDTRSDDELIFDNLRRPVEMFAEVLAVQKHQLAEQIRANNKKTGSPEDEPETIEAEVVDDEMPSGAAEDAKTVFIQNQTNIEHQTVNNFDLKDAHDITFNL